MEIRQFNRVCLDYVRYQFLGTNKIDSLQTFAVVNSFDDINAENLKKTINSRYRDLFFSKKFAALGSNPSKIEFEYPAMFFLSSSFEVEKPFEQRREECTRIQMAFLYPDLENCECEYTKANNKRLEIEEIERLVGKLAQGFFDYLCGIKCVNVEDKQIYLHEKLLTFYPEYKNKIDRAKTANFQTMLRKRNPVLSGSYVDQYTKDNLYGRIYNFVFCTMDCEKGTFNPIEDCCEKKTIVEIGCC